MLCYLRALLFKTSWYHYVILQRWGKSRTLAFPDLAGHHRSARLREPSYITRHGAHGVRWVAVQPFQQPSSQVPCLM